MACMPSRVQADPSNSADTRMEGYRSYMQQRQLPALVLEHLEYSGDIDPDDALPDDVLAVAPHLPELVKQRMAKCTTAQLEGHLSYYHDRLLEVRAANALGASIWGSQKGFVRTIRLWCSCEQAWLCLMGVSQAQTTTISAVAPLLAN